MLKHIYPDSTPHHACTVLPALAKWSTRCATQVAVQPMQLPTQHAGTPPHDTGMAGVSANVSDALMSPDVHTWCR
jgi:hypothetical protein